MSATLRWGLIGASDVAVTRMIPAMRRMGHEVAAVGDPTPDWAITYAERNGIAAGGTVEELVARDDVDAVYISTRNEFHRDHAILAAQAGKHILCEKPLALSLEDGQAMLAAAETAGVILGSNHHLPGCDTHRTIREMVHAGAIGRLLAIRVFHAVMLPPRLQGWRLASKAGGGVALDVTCHDAAVINPLVGELPVDIVALATKQGSWEAAAEDALMSTMRYANGVLVQTHDAFTVAYAPTGLHVIGEDGAILAANVMTQEPIGTVVLRDAKGEREIDIPNRRDLYDINVGGFAAAVHGEAAHPVVTGLEGLQAAHVALAVREAAETGSRVTL
jgi:1,5-anhydro-D-fructose reductase (1,5-anhydro-D-mannitol-forming)